MNEFLMKYYQTNSEQATIEVLEDAKCCADELFAVTGDETYIDVATTLNSEIEAKMEEEDVKILSRLGQVL